MIFNLKKTKTEKINMKKLISNLKSIINELNPEQIKKFLKFFTNAIQAEMMYKISCHGQALSDSKIFNSIFFDRSLMQMEKIDKNVNIADTPIITGIWDKKRTYDSIVDFAKDPGSFNGIEYKSNIQAILIKPLDIVVVRGGNHSVNSAIVQNVGKINVAESYDFSALLDKYYFDGECYRLKDSYDDNWNKIFPISPSFGIMFEIARIIKDKSKN